MKRRKRMGMYKAPATSSRASIETTAVPRTHDVVEMPRERAHDPLRSAFESTPEKFVAFVNRMAATDGRLTSKERDAGSAWTLAGDRS